MPLPNDYTVGDGLNTAGIRFTRRISGMDMPASEMARRRNRDQFNMRIDHNFNSNHKLSVVYTWERDSDMTTQAGIMQWPGGYNGQVSRWPRLFTVSLVSTLSPNCRERTARRLQDSRRSKLGAVSSGKRRR